LVALAAIGTGAAANQGCTVTTGALSDDGGITFPDNDSSTPGSDSSTPIPADEACRECVYPSCTGPDAVCFNDPECYSIYQCAIGSTDAGPNNALDCFNAGTAKGQSEYNALFYCDLAAQCTTCTSQCASDNPRCDLLPDASTPPPAPDSGGETDSGGGTDSSTAADTSAPPPAQTCQQCTAASCATQTAACAAGTDCQAYLDCVQACQTAECVPGCGTSHAKGQTDSAALGSCTATSCAGPCGS
jgi:hypothetical protein